MAEDFYGPTLADAIAQVGWELEEALREGEGRAVRFGVESVDLEFTVEARQVRGGDVGVRFYVVSLGGKGERQWGETSRVSVSLKPVGAGGEPLQVASSGWRRPNARPDGDESGEGWGSGRPDAVFEDGR